MSAFKSTYLSPSALVFFHRVNHSHSLSFSQVVTKINTKTPFSNYHWVNKKLNKTVVIFRIFISL